jgi:hypothetical protein
MQCIMQKDLLEAVEEHPDWKEKSIKEGDPFA